MLRRFSVKGVVDALASTRNAVAPPCGVGQQPARAFCAAATAPTRQADKTKPDWAPGTPASGREQTLGEAFAAMQHHGRGARKVRANVLNLILSRISSDEELKYAHLGLELFKKKGIELAPKTGSLFIKACCKAGSPQAAVDALAKAEKYGLDGAITPKRFNYLLSQLYRAGDTDTFARAVAEANARQLPLNPRSHVLIGKFEAEMRARKEEEERKIREKEEEKIRKEKQAEAELKAREEEEAKQKLEEEEKKRKAEEEEEREKQRQAEEDEEKVKAAEQQAKKAADEEEKSQVETEAAAATGGGSDVASSPDGDVDQGVEEEKGKGVGAAEGPEEDAETKR